MLTHKMMGKEDCLVLNVYTTALPNGESNFQGKDVMVWTHGGALMVGSGHKGSQGPELLLDHDVVRKPRFCNGPEIAMKAWVEFFF